MADNTGLTREFLAERDTRIFRMRQAGTPVADIARRLGISTGAVHAAVRRQLEKLNREALLAYPEVLRLELERLDTLQQAIWPLTQHRKQTLPDGTEINVEPDLRAVAEVRAIMTQRAKLLGMEQNQMIVTVDAPPQRAALAGHDGGPTQGRPQFDPEAEARKLLELMGTTGVLPNDTVKGILGSPDIIDAELIEERPG